jgi:phage-related baseplate assembly protein
MTLFTAETLDMSRIGPPSVAEVDFEAARARLLAEFKRLWEEARRQDPSLPAYDVEMLESDPAVILTEEFAFGETLLRQAINDAADSLRLATAVGPDLDHIAKTYHDTQRLLLVPGDAAANPPREPLYESDEDYRLRAQIAPEALPLHGLTAGGYAYRVRRLFGDRVKGARALHDGAGRIRLVLLARAGDGSVDDALVADIRAAYDAERHEGLTDVLSVVAARIVAAPVRVVIGLPPGPDPVPVAAAARAAIERLAAERHAIGETLHVQAIGAVAKVPPARYVRVIEPLADIEGGADGAPWASAIAVETEIER